MEEETQFSLTLVDIEGRRSIHAPSMRRCIGVRLPTGAVVFGKAHEAETVAFPSPITRCPSCRALAPKVAKILTDTRKRIEKQQARGVDPSIVDAEVREAEKRVRELTR